MSAKMITYTDSSCASELNLSLQAKEQTKMSVNISLFSDCCFFRSLLFLYMLFVVVTHFKGKRSETGRNFNKLTQNLHGYNAPTQLKYHSNLNIFPIYYYALHHSAHIPYAPSAPPKRSDRLQSRTATNITITCLRWLCIIGRICPNTHIKIKYFLWTINIQWKEWNRMKCVRENVLIRMNRRPFSVCVNTAHVFAAVHGICDVQEGSLFLINFKPPFNDTIASRCSPFMPNICKKLIYEKSLTDFFPFSLHSFWLFIFIYNRNGPYTGWAQSSYDKFNK